MNLQGFDVRHLTMLDVLFSERHVGRTAARLHLSQPAVSNTLGWLRRHFGDPLLVRHGGAMQLTPFAERLRAPVRRLLVEMRTLAGARPAFDPATETKRLRITCSQYVAMLLMPALMRSVAAEAPGVSIDAVPVQSDLNEFARGQVDLVIMPASVLFPDHDRQALFRDPWVCVGCADRAPWGTTLDAATYRAARHALPDQPQTVTADLAALGVERTVAATAPYAVIADLVAGTPLIATLPQALLATARSRDRLKVAPLPFAVPPVEVAQQWHSEQADEPGSAWLRGHVRRAVAVMAAEHPSIDPTL